jgi:hypothetical protein
VGVGLLAIYLGIRGLMQVTAAISSAWSMRSVLDVDRSMALMLQNIAVSGGAALLFSAAPAALLFRYRDAIGDRLVSVNDPGPALAIGSSDALSVGCLLLAISFGLSAATGAFVAVCLIAVGLWTDALQSSPMTRIAVQSGSAALVQALGALLLQRYARNLARRAPPA